MTPDVPYSIRSLYDPSGWCEHPAVSITFVGLNILPSDMHLQL